MTGPLAVSVVLLSLAQASQNEPAPASDQAARSVPHHGGVGGPAVTAVNQEAAAQFRAASPDGSPLGLADLPGYREALQPAGPGEKEAPAIDVTFRALWDHPEEWRGKRVRVTGRVVRAFHQGGFGTFPALAEAWVSTQAGDLTCLVFPETASNPAPALGKEVQFAGTFLRRLQYRGADVPRLAPLIVGSQAPTRVDGRGPARGADPLDAPAMSKLDLVFGLMMGIIVLGVLARLHLRRPLHLKVRPESEPAPPRFVDDFESEGDLDER